MDRINKDTERLTNKKRDRCPDCSEQETYILLDVAQEVQLNNGKSDLNFTSTDMTQIHTLFCQKTPGASRQSSKLYHRIRNIKKEFTTFKRWASKSGWSWDYENHVPMAPTPEILKQVIEQGGKSMKHFHGKKFPWFAKMDEIMGGSQTKGRGRDTDVGDTSISATGSQTGSSDDHPDDVDNAPTDQETQPDGSEASVPMSGSSGSYKRKSTDSVGPSTQGKRVHLAMKERKTEIKDMNATGKEIVQSVKEFTNVKMGKTNELHDCYKKLDELNVRGHLRYLCVTQMKFQAFRTYFLSSTLEQIMEHFNYEMNPQQHWANPSNQQHQQQGPYMQFFQPQTPPAQGNPPSCPQNFSDQFNYFGLNPRSPGH